MGFSNGNLTSKAVKVQKGDREAKRSYFVKKVSSGYPGLSDHMGTFSSRLKK